MGCFFSLFQTTLLFSLLLFHVSLPKTKDRRNRTIKKPRGHNIFLAGEHSANIFTRAVWSMAWRSGRHTHPLARHLLVISEAKLVSSQDLLPPSSPQASAGPYGDPRSPRSMILALRYALLDRDLFWRRNTVEYKIAILKL